tara:strand:+ start:44003 stop:45274 length:1272 start_codon:yes stop_codon:yes gene_type:complete
MEHIKLFEEWLTDKSQPFLFEGGAAGHMAHPFDDKDLTFGDFKAMIDSGLRGELNFEEDATEKTDGQNAFATIQDGEVKFARNKTELKNPMTLAEFKNKFEGHASKLVQDTFQFAAQDLANLLMNLSPADQEKYFKNGKDFMNMELIYSQNPNVIHYDTDVIQFHGIKETDGEGNIIGTNNRPAKEITDILKKVKSDIGKTFKIIPPRVIKLQQDLDFTTNKKRFINQVNALEKKYGLTDSDEVSKYHEMWWRELIDKEFPTLSQDVKEGLLKRWAYGDKKSLNMRSLAKQIGKTEAALVSKFDKEDVKKKYKENIRPFEDLFLELGSVILKNASDFLAANPSDEAQRLRAQIQTAGSKIKKTGGVEQIKKVEAELARLDRIGGIESIFPTEGIVFKYKGKIYKLTGTFAAINQLLGIIKYGN